jgi:hypothetical protein
VRREANSERQKPGSGSGAFTFTEEAASNCTVATFGDELDPRAPLDERRLLRFP